MLKLSSTPDRGIAYAFGGRKITHMLLMGETADGTYRQTVTTDEVTTTAEKWKTGDFSGAEFVTGKYLVSK